MWFGLRVDAKVGAFQYSRIPFLHNSIEVFAQMEKVIFVQPTTDLNGLMGEEGDIATKMVFLKWMGLLNIHRHEVTQCAILLLQLPIIKSFKFYPWN
jgi:hypothetical protein